MALALVPFFSQVPTWITDLIVSLGGASAITIAIATYIGKIWEKKYVESVKQEHKKEIEDLKQEHNKEIESYKIQLQVIKQTSLRYSNSQFKIYNKLWTTLCDLRIATNNLWERSSEENMVAFSKLLKEATGEIEASSLLIEDNHYLEMREVLSVLGQYKLGKIRVIDIHNTEDLISDDGARMRLGAWVNDNRQSKERFENTLAQIRQDLRKQIRGTLNN